ncbi:MAG: tetratricopeptide repeat protein, partial [Pyrinomonadaceae bacterium]
MRLELERSEAIFPAVENAAFDEVIVSPDFQALLEKGISAAQTGDRELARKLLTKAAAINPQSEDAWMWLASISNYPEELLAFLNNVLNINPDNARAIEWRTATCDLLAKTFVERGVTAYEEGSLEQAAQSFDLALTHDYDCAAAWFWKSKLAPSDDQRLDCLRRVLSINVDNHEARDEFDAIMLSRSSSALDDAKVAALGGNSQKAVELLDAALENDPANADAWVLRSHLLSSLPEKLSSLEKALAIDPANAAARSGYDFLSAMITAAPPLESAEGKEPEFVASHIEENHEPVVEVFHDVAESVDDIEIAAANDEPIHAVEDMFTPAVEPIDPDSDTIESLPPIDEILELQASPFGSEAESSEEVFADDDNA